MTVQRMIEQLQALNMPTAYEYSKRFCKEHGLI